MRSSSVGFSKPNLRVLTSVITALLVGLGAGCASTSSGVEFDTKSEAQRLGVADCRVSLPISEEMVVEDAKRLGNPKPEENQEWIDMRANLQPGDELRVVDCLRSKERTYYYALTRNESIVMRFYSSIFD